MLRNYLVVAYRSLRRHLDSTLVNLSGLAIGVMVCVLFGTLSWSLLTWDAFRPESDHLYRVFANWERAASWSTGGNTWGTTLPELKATYPEVETGTRVLTISQFVTPEGAEDAAVLSQEMARPYFGDTDPIGKTLRLDGESTVTVTGIVRNPPPNTLLDPDVVVNVSHARMNDINDRRDGLQEAGGASFLDTYVRVREGAAPPRWRKR